MTRLSSILFAALCVISQGASAGNTTHNKDPGGTSGSVLVPQAWARATPGASTIGAAYLTIKNSSKADDKLVSVVTGIAGRVELHTHITDNGIMRMRRMNFIDIPAGKTVVLKPGGDHLMLFDLKGPLKTGQKFELILRFKKSGPVSVSTNVLTIGSPGPGKIKPAGKAERESKMQTGKEVLERHRGSHSHN